jgi:hypothetical protein
MRLSVCTKALMLRGKTSRWWLLLILLLALGFGALGLQAQVIRIKVVNGKNGKPVANLDIMFNTEIPAWSPYSLFTDRNGEVAVKVGSFTKMVVFTPSNEVPALSQADYQRARSVYAFVFGRRYSQQRHFDGE